MEIVARYCAARFFKVVGNFLKILAYPLFFLFPQARFTIPHRSRPFIARRSAHRIPKILWQTNYTDRVTLPVYLNYLFNRLMSPTYEYRFMGDAERCAFVNEHCSGPEREAYGKLRIGAAQADLWRVLVLRKFGGVYLDIDAHVVWPLGSIIKPYLDELYIRHKNGELSNYFIASAPNNPNLTFVVEAILDNIARLSSADVFQLTGPGPLDRTLRLLNTPPAVYYKYTCYQGSFTNEFFQYMDHPQGKWNKAQKKMPVVGS
jgi:mannosyltransferase OCH1-like enzyme